MYYYNKHYIRLDGAGRVIDGWSDGPLPDRDTDGAICICEQGGYQFRLEPDGAENPALYNWDGIPLYKWDGQAVQPRTEAEIAADREERPAPPPSEIERLRQEMTDLQMAVCETYELLLGGNDNG